MRVLALAAAAVLVAPAAGWSEGHSLINRAVLEIMPPALLDRLTAATTLWPPGAGGTEGNLTGFVGGLWAESGDDVAGPCAASLTTPCSASAVRAKMALRNYCCALPPPLTCRPPHCPFRRPAHRPHPISGGPARPSALYSTAAVR